jgi:hypothetical protein
MNPALHKSIICAKLPELGELFLKLGCKETDQIGVSFLLISTNQCACKRVPVQVKPEIVMWRMIDR